MIYLFLSIICSSAIFIIFKYFEKFKVTTFTAIVINYLFASITGFFALEGNFSIERIVSAPWFLNSLFLGVVFISLFNVMALTAQKLGPSVASISNKMALVIPVVFAIFFYNDSLSIFKVSGVILALAGVYLSTLKPSSSIKKIEWKLLFMPFILFIGSGFIDTFLKYNQEFYLSDPVDAKLFSACIFLTACIIGTIIMVINKSKRSFNRPTILGGVILGVINYGSIYFLIQIFNHTSLESSVVFPLNNMAVVLLTAISSFFIFQERFSRLNKVGLFVSTLSLAFILFAN